jgi:hypothetical protein
VGVPVAVEVAVGVAVLVGVDDAKVVGVINCIGVAGSVSVGRSGVGLRVFAAVPIKEGVKVD